MAVEIISYCDAHFESVDALWREVFPDSPPRNRAENAIPAKLAVQPDLMLVAVVDGDIVGTTMAGYDGHRGWLYSVAVRPSLKGQGIGRLLVREAEKRLFELGCVKINLQVLADNPVTAFYERLGYVVEERVSMGKSLI